MKLWLLCFVLIFAAAEGLQGFSGWPNLVPTSFWHPLTVLAGIGLAVLSNATALGLGSNPSLSAPTQPPPDTPPPLPPASAAAPAHGTTKAKASRNTKATKAKATPKIKATKAKANSISFDIRKPSQPESPQP